jgi:uncharacterized protein YdhG (YjbR/CyaY superfamily)
MKTSGPENIDAYIAGFPGDVQIILQQIRAIIKTAAPMAEEKISYGMPAFNLNKVILVYFAAYKNHIGLYPAPIGIEVFKAELSPYKTGKGSVQFPLDKSIPFDLIAEIVKFRIMESSDRIKAKKNKA